MYGYREAEQNTGGGAQTCGDRGGRRGGVGYGGRDGLASSLGSGKTEAGQYVPQAHILQQRHHVAITVQL